MGRHTGTYPVNQRLQRGVDHEIQGRRTRIRLLGRCSRARHPNMGGSVMERVKALRPRVGSYEWHNAPTTWKGIVLVLPRRSIMPCFVGESFCDAHVFTVQAAQ